MSRKNKPTMIQGIVAIPLLALAAWAVVRIVNYYSANRRAGRMQKIPASGNRTPSSSQYPAASVLVTPMSCKPAQMIKGMRYLAEDAPPLPLPDCTITKCHCTYVHHTDRRTGTLDRRRLLGVKKDYLLFFGNEDPREGRGRRASDWSLAYQIDRP